MANKPEIKLRIRDLREDADLTQQTIANYLMCDQSLYSKYERGLRQVPVGIIVALAAYYGVTVDYILGLSEYKEPYRPK
jgi:transcriptional regulator with XRE-family HTH domain